MHAFIEWSIDGLMRRAYAHAVESLNADGQLFLGDVSLHSLRHRTSRVAFTRVFPAFSLRLFSMIWGYCGHAPACGIQAPVCGHQRPCPCLRVQDPSIPF